LIITIIALVFLVAWLYFFDSRNLSPEKGDNIVKQTAGIISVSASAPTSMTSEVLPVSSTTSKNSKVNTNAVKLATLEESEQKLIEQVDVQSSTVLPVKSVAEKIEKQATVQASEKNFTVKKIEPKKKSTLTITPLQMSNSELAQLKLSQGLKAHKAGKINYAQSAWKQALEAEPRLHEARIQLAASYYGANETTRALTLLLQSVKQFPKFDGYSLLAAQIYYQLDNPQQALVVLNNPYLDENSATENILLAGSIAQQLQQWPVAMNNYQVLVGRQADNPQWLLGLAIAQDAQNMKTQALGHYSRLLSLNNVESTVMHYAKQRAQALREETAERGNNG